MTMLQFPPVVHRDDPLSSFRAAIDHTESGVRGENVRRLLISVQTNPGLTAVDYTDLAQMKDDVETRRRLTDLKNQGRIFREGTVKPKGQRLQARWWPRLSQAALL